MKTNHEDLAHAMHDAIQKEDISAISSLISQHRNVLSISHEKLLPVEQACRKGLLSASLLLISETLLKKEQYQELIETVKKQRLKPTNSSKRKEYDQILYALDRFYRYQHFFEKTENNPKKVKQAIIALFEDYYAPKSVKVIQPNFLKRVFTFHLMRKHTKNSENLVERLKSTDDEPNELLKIFQEKQSNPESFSSSFWRRWKWSELILKQLEPLSSVTEEQPGNAQSIPDTIHSYTENPVVFPYDNRFMCDLESSNFNDPKIHYFIEKLSENLIKNIQHCHRKARDERAVPFDDINQMIDEGSACLPQDSQSYAQGVGHLLLTSFKLKSDIKTKELEILFGHLKIDINKNLNNLELREAIQNHCVQAAQQLAHRFKESINNLTTESINILIKYFINKIIKRLSKNSVSDIQYFPEISLPAFLVQLATHKSSKRSGKRISKKIQIEFEQTSKYSENNTTIEGLLIRSDLIYPDGQIIRGKRSEKYPPQYVPTEFSSPHYVSFQFQSENFSSIKNLSGIEISVSPSSTPITLLHQFEKKSSKKTFGNFKFPIKKIK